MTTVLAWARKARKFLVAVSGVAAQAVALGVVPSAELHYVQTGLSVLTALGVYATPNDGTPTPS